ncbi:hypothetical protein PsYK624_077390 [Phanerochaete sordida]|uniref:Yeast cell wall synthesis Kre9/Knh1-like N-terminal domain-containing protein n=1 Tax=Phanerochaete sordida TaxID=48140 RepID=A0A9P3GC08_9APHY|nr:hypothetical protein PsYK624_077390 [Phanerochaete sordida]
MAHLRVFGVLALAAINGSRALYTGDSGSRVSLGPATVSGRDISGDYGDNSHFLVARHSDSSDSGILFPRDVWSPKITSPTGKTVWIAGTNVTVTWDTSNQPADITNPVGKVLLGHVEDGTDEHLDVDHPLADGFDIRAGKVQVTVPNVSPGSDYIIVVMGDSGNKSPTFTIN